MIESGTLVPGISAGDFRLPPHTALRYEHPHPRLKPFISDYHVLDSDGPYLTGQSEWMLPSWPAIRFIMTDAPITVQIGERVYDPMPAASLYATTTRAMKVTAHGGVTIGASLSPLGWSRFFDISADAVCDQIVPLGSVMPDADVEGVFGRLKASDQAREVKPILDAFFLANLGQPAPHEADLIALMQLLYDREVTNLEDAAADIGLSGKRLRSLSLRYFGFTPKTLLSRTRFVRSFLTLLMADGRPSYAGVSEVYHDTSHFLRDAHRFLGMTPLQFMRMPTPYLRAALRARALVFGVPTEAVDGSV